MNDTIFDWQCPNCLDPAYDCACEFSYICRECGGNLEVGVDEAGGLCYWCKYYEPELYDMEKDPCFE